MGRKHKFILTVAGQSHVAQVNCCLKYLKTFTRREIVVLSVRAADIDHDNVEEVLLPQYDDYLASRYLKTNVYNILRNRDTCCYIDNDVYAVGEVDKIFGQYRPPIFFANDQMTKVSNFSMWALRNGQQLKDAIREKFNVTVGEHWPLWNGGVFLFNASSEEFLNTWWQYTLAVYEDIGWFNRDQGALVATVWKHGLQKHSRLAPEYNWIPKRTEIQFECQSPFINGRTIEARPGRSIKFLHFIHKGKEEDAEILELAELFLQKQQGIRFL